MVLSELQKQELNQTLRERSKKVNDAYGERHLKQANLNVTANASLMQPRLGETSVIQNGSNIDIDPEAHPSCDFVKNHSFQRTNRYQPHISKDLRDGAVLNPTHTAAMEQAMLRHEADLKRKTNLRELQEADHQGKIECDNAEI
jgi:hypothetical protein